MVCEGYNEENAQGLFSAMLIIQWIYPQLVLHFYILMLVKTSDRPHNMLTNVSLVLFFTQKSENRPGFISEEPLTKVKVINYSDALLPLFFPANRLYRSSFVFIAHYFSILLDYKSWTVFHAFKGLHFSSLFISFSLHPISRLSSCWYWLPQLTWQ